ncbi:TolC family protein [Paraburkholderia sediminicola]|uniref:TolC family protein n=1 Tax=Paraburkholderia sediminicola TaxID=458836 RepID=UPI0038BAC9EA
MSENPYSLSSPMRREYDEFRKWVLGNKKLVALSPSKNPGDLLSLSGTLEAKGVSKLSTELLEQRLSAVSKILATLDVHTCSTLIRGGFNLPEFTIQAFPVMNSFDENEAKAWMQVNRAAIEAQLTGSPDIVLPTFNRAKAEGDLQAALGTLAADMFLSPDQPVTMPAAEDGVVPDQDFTASISSMIEEAQTIHPAIAAARAKLDAAIASEQQTRAEGLPNLSLIAKYSQNNQPASLGLGQPEFAATGRDWYVGVQLQIPLFEGLSRTYKVREAQAQTEVQADTLDEARQQVGLDVWKSYQALQTNIQSVGNTATLKQLAQRSFEVARRRYAAGVGSILELLTAQKALSDAKQQRIQALTDWRAARLQLAAKMGRLNAGDLRTEHIPPQ